MPSGNALRRQHPTARPAPRPSHSEDHGEVGAFREVRFMLAPSSAAGAAAVADAVASRNLKARGAYTRRCETLLRERLGAKAVMLVNSCTSALELSALLLGVGPGDEVIMPSFGFASAPNAFVLRGATPVFVDILPGTLNIDPDAVAAAITPRTRVIVPVHYAGVGADMTRLQAIADEHGLAIVEDAAQGIGASQDGRALGSIGTLGAISFDATKNLSSGSGGALVINDPELALRAEALRDYGTDRARYTRGEVGHYRWVEAGSNYAMNELAAAYLWPQLQDLDTITAARVAVWDRYHAAFAPAETAGLLRRPVLPAGCEHNAHIYGLSMPSARMRTHMLSELLERGVEATFHYVPLHSAPAGRIHARTHGDLSQTDDLSARLLRLPLYADMDPADVDHVIATVLEVLPQRVWTVA